MGTIAAGEAVSSRRPRLVSIYQSLLGNLALVIVLLSGAIMALTFIGSKETVERLSGVILRETIRLIELELRQFFEIEDFPNAPAEVVEQEKKHFGRS